ncbi:translocation/assembly module TamB domain-containing protein [Marinobacter mobilis]|uniref:Translocation and assembly module TamB n=1 Tax=Marinobacter mobilis TaxID=488533 RepID=A0A1H2YRZ4_9GAMM|nr:translocation/assembly module TamB domain-containing protein [Marinobacter mobilis]SDX07795.1 translocation and assembly module TamB [Marinobacter mobilis]
MKTRRFRWLRVAMISLVGIGVWLLLAVTGLLIALGSDSGTRWVLSQIPGLEVENGQGSLFGRWQAEQLRWRGYGVAADLAFPLVDWSPACLITLTVCLDELSVAQTNVEIQPSPDETESGPFTLSSIQLPVDLDVRQVTLGALTVNQSLIWSQVSISAEGVGSAWQLHQLSYRREALAVNVSGWLETRGDWPLALEVTGQLPPPYGDHWELALNLSGNARNLRVQGTSDGYLQADIQGRVEPFEDNLPAELAVRAREFLALDTLPETLMLTTMALNLDGSLANGYRARAEGSFAGAGDAIGVAAAGILTDAGVDDLRVTLTSAEGGQAPGQVTLTGDMDWHGGLVATADIVMNAFPWYQLVPELAPPPVVVEALQGDIRYDNGRYQAHLNTRVNGPQGPADLEGLVNGDLQALTLEELLITTGAGRASGRGDLQFAGPLAWNLDLILQQFNPGYWLPLLEASLDGEVASEGQFGDAGLVMEARWDIGGLWQSHPGASQGLLSVADDDWRLMDFSLAVGNNRVSGQGRWKQQIDAQLSIELPSPELLVPGFQGQLQGEVKARGALSEPEGDLTLSGTQISWQDEVEVSRVNLVASLRESLMLDANLRVSGLSAGEQGIDLMEARFTGNPQQHALALEASAEALTTRLRLEGRWSDGWKGVLSRGEIELPQADQVWQLDGPAALTYRPETSVEFGAHCWSWQESSVCAGDQLLWPDLAINYQLTDFPTRVLAPLLPPSIRWHSQLTGSMAIAMTNQGPDGQIELAADAGEVGVLVGEEWQALAYDTFSVSLGLKPETARFELALSGPEVGRLSSTLTLNPSSPDYPMAGEFELEGLNIAPVGLMADLEVLEGTIGGSGRLSGPLLRPDITGELYLTHGRLLDPRIPIPMEEIELQLGLNGQTAEIDGHWKSHERSSGQLRGSFDWRETPLLELAVTGQRLPFSYEPYASVELDPDLILQYRGGALTVKGTLAVPRGQIAIKELPSQAVTVSSDEVIVGAAAEDPVLRSLVMDVWVTVGADQVTFDGFGIHGDLKGGLRVGNNLDARGVLQLEDGHFEAFGTELELRRARLVFVGSLTEPYLDVEAVRVVDEVTAGLRLTGPVSAPATEVFSEPAMSQPNALSYVILGRPLQTEGDQGQVGQAAISLGLSRASQVTEKIGDELGIEQLVLETEGSGEEASVVASGYLTEDLSVRYGVGIFEPISTVALRYDLGRYFYLEAASGLAASLDLFYTRDF